MESVGEELMELQLVTEKPMVQDGRRMSVISLAFTLKSVSQVAVVLFGSNLQSQLLCMQVHMHS